MPEPLDTPSPISPSGADSQSSSASRSEVSSTPFGSRDIPHAVKVMAMSIDPSLTRHDLDYLMHVVESSGLLASFGKDGFQDGLLQAVRVVSGSVGRVLSSKGLR